MVLHARGRLAPRRTIFAGSGNSVADRRAKPSQWEFEAAAMIVAAPGERRQTRHECACGSPVPFLARLPGASLKI